MACGTCGQRRQTIDQATAAAVAAGRPVAKYIVTGPNGEHEEFARYIEAVVYKRTINGTLTTTTA